MGLFGNKEVCALCGGKVSMIGKLQVYDGVICGSCRAKCSPLATSLPLKTVSKISEHIQAREHNAVAYKSFAPTDQVGDYLMIDRKTQTWCSPHLDKKNPDIFQFCDILDFELVEDGVSITKGGLGSAVVGGALFGGVGAIVGGGLGKKQKDVVSKMSVVINLKNEFVSRLDIPLITSDTKKGGMLYKGSKEIAGQIMALLAVTSDSQDVAAASSQHHPIASTADELMKFKQLLDAGAITQEEYEAKKKQLLGL